MIAVIDYGAGNLRSISRALQTCGQDIVVTVVNLDPHGTREGTISMDMPALGFDWHETFAAHDELSGQTFHWGQFDFVRLDPAVEPAHVLTIHRWGT